MSSCTLRPPPSIHTSIDTIAHVALVSTFLSVFYFIYVDQVEGQIVSVSINRVVDEMLDQASAIEGRPITEDPRFRKAIMSLRAPDTAAADAEVARSNAKVRNKAFVMMGCIVSASIIAIAVLWSVGRRRAGPGYTKRDFKWLLVSNAHLLMSAAITEFLFLVMVARNFRVLGAGWTEKQLTSRVIEWASE